MIFFDFLYYYIFSWYSNTKNTGPEGSACFAVSGLQIFNIFSVYMLYTIARHNKFDIPKLFSILLFICLVIFNYIKYVYSDKRQADIKNKWESKPDEYKLQFRKFLGAYIIISFGLFFGCVIVLASRAGI